MELPIYQVDAFTNDVFKGNPAAVVPLQEWLPDDVLQNIALENNLSETAFFIPDGDGFHLRWFTPTTEVDLCGHATLATSWIIYNELGYKKPEINFKSQSGTLIVQKNQDKLTLNFPNWETIQSTDIDPIFEKALGRAPLEVHKGKKWVAIYEDPAFIKAVTPDIALLGTIDSQGVIITAQSNNDNLDFVSRYFGPQVGIDEDPVTGSAHCVITPIWVKKLSKTKLKAYQASERGGNLDLELQGDRVYITGQAALYMKGKIYI